MTLFQKIESDVPFKGDLRGERSTLGIVKENLENKINKLQTEIDLEEKKVIDDKIAGQKTFCLQVAACSIIAGLAIGATLEVTSRLFFRR